MTDSYSSSTQTTGSGPGKLQGKVTIVTGGASGIGEATARRFAHHGARAVVIADIQDGLGKEVAASIPGGSYFRCDVTDEEQVRALVDHTVAAFGRLDVMFSNAGAISQGDQVVLDLDLEKLDRLFAVNARGAAACVKHAARVMIAGGVRGNVVCTASKAGGRGLVTMTDYTMSKHAVMGLVRSASLQLGQYGIRVNSVSPGLVSTPLSQSWLNIGDGKEDLEMVEKIGQGGMALKIGRMIQPENVAEAVVFLASDDAEFINGHDLSVDGALPH